MRSPYEFPLRLDLPAIAVWNAAQRKAKAAYYGDRPIRTTGAAGTCRVCGGPRPKVRGRMYCDDCALVRRQERRKAS